MAIQQQQSPPQSDMSLTQAIEMVAKDKGIDKGAPRQDRRGGDPQGRAERRSEPTRELEARFNEETGQVDLFQYMTVVDDVVGRGPRDRRSRRRGRAGSRQSWARSSGSRSSGTRHDAKKAAEQDREFGDILQRQAGARSRSDASRRRRPSRSSSSASATKSATSSSTSTRTRRASSSRGSSAGSRRATTSSSTSDAPRGSCPSASRRRARPTARATASSPTSRTSTARRAGPQVILVARRPAPRREALRGRGARRSTRASCASSPAPASPARGRRSP